MGLFDGIRGIFGESEESEKNLADQIQDFKQSYNLSPEMIEGEKDSAQKTAKNEGEGKNPVQSFMDNSKQTLRSLGGGDSDVTEIDKERIQDQMESLQDQLSDLNSDESN